MKDNTHIWLVLCVLLVLLAIFTYKDYPVTSFVASVMTLACAAKISFRLIKHEGAS